MRLHLDLYVEADGTVTRGTAMWTRYDTLVAWTSIERSPLSEVLLDLCETYRTSHGFGTHFGVSQFTSGTTEGSEPLIVEH